MKTIDAALMCADNMRTTIDAEGFACAEDFALVCLAAEVRRLREQVASDEITIELIDHRLESFRDDNARLREENERLKSNPPQSLSQFTPDWANYQQGSKDGRADAVAEMRMALSKNPVRRMTISGQRLSYVQLDELNGELDAIYSKALPEPAP